jgi:hypothetical protein
LDIAAVRAPHLALFTLALLARMARCHPDSRGDAGAIVLWNG